MAPFWQPLLRFLFLDMRFNGELHGKKYDDIAVAEIKEFMELMADIILANDKK